LSKSSGKLIFERQEALDDLDKRAGEELDGLGFDDLEDELKQEVESDTESTVEEPEAEFTDKPEKSVQGYDVQDVIHQLDGMIEHWFQLAVGMEGDKKENFLKLGDRLQEIMQVMKSEFR